MNQRKKRAGLGSRSERQSRTGDAIRGGYQRILETSLKGSKLSKLFGSASQRLKAG
jgi:hypothetical protein